MICILTNRPYVITNPGLQFIGDEMMELMKMTNALPAGRTINPPGGQFFCLWLAM